MGETKEAEVVAAETQEEEVVEKMEEGRGGCVMYYYSENI